MSTPLDTLGRRIRFARLEAGMTGADLGILTGGNSRNAGAVKVHHWEHDRKRVHPADLNDIADILCVRLPWLAWGEGVMRIPANQPTTPSAA